MRSVVHYNGSQYNESVVSKCFLPSVYSCANGRLLLRNSPLSAAPAAQRPSLESQYGQPPQQQQQQPTTSPIVRTQLPLALQPEYQQELTEPSAVFEQKAERQVEAQRGQRQQTQLQQP